MIILPDTLCHIFVVGPNQGIAEIPRMFLKHSVVCLETNRLQIFDGENSGGSSVPLTERMYLPNARNEAR